MQQVNVTELRNHLPHYMNQVQKGIEFIVTSHGKNIARLVPEIKSAEEAYNRLMQLRGTVIQKDILDPIEVKWYADADNL